MALTSADLEIIRTALVEYSRTLHDRSRQVGYSEVIGLCVQRMNVEDLLLRVTERETQ